MSPAVFNQHSPAFLNTMTEPGGEVGAMIPVDSNSTDPVQKSLARHEEALGEMWAFSGWLQKVTEEHFGQIRRAQMDEQAFARRMGSAFENLREKWPVMEQQRNEWIQEHFVLHQKWLESLKKDLVNEVNAFEQKATAAMPILEWKSQQIFQ